ncbi:MAG TPA: VWA domain-containing protein [Bryobacteraceae bacterium]|jgi:VWFA-related protein
MFPRKSFVFGVLFTLTGSFAAPTETAPQVVNLNVTAVDQQGQPVTDLRSEDFQILDNNKPRKIVWFHPLSGKAPKTPATFILIDLLNADFAARGLSVNEVERALEKLEAADNVYLYLLTSAERIFAIHAVTPPGTRSETDDGPWTSHLKPMLNNAMKQVNALKSQDDRVAALRIPGTWKALSELAAQLALVPGPKSFVWVTQGIENGYELPDRQFYVDTTPLRLFASNLNALETAIYTVQQKPSGGLAMQNEGSPGDTLAQLTALTGGRAFSTDAVDAAITQAMSAPRHVNYRMAFLPEKMDGKYHKIRVTTARKDIRIQTAQTYYAIAAPDAEERDAAIVDAMMRSPFDYSEIGVTATIQPVGGKPGQFRVAIHVDASDVLFLKENGRYRARLETGAFPDGTDVPKAGSHGPLDLDMSEEDYAKAMAGGIDFGQEAGLDQTIRRIRLAVLDRNSNLAGTVTLPVSRNP